MDRKHRIIQAFDNSVIQYHKSAFIQKNIAFQLASFFPEKIHGTILEIGCGTGFLTKHLISHYPQNQIVITDLSPTMLNFTKKNSAVHKNIAFEILDGEAPPSIYLGAFDLIVTSMSLQWFSNPQHSLKMLQSFLTPNGLLLYATLGQDNFPEWKQTLSALSLKSGLLQQTRLPGEIFSEKINVPHNSALEFLKTLKKQGTFIANQGVSPLPLGQMLRALKFMDQNHKSHTWHISYGKLPLSA